MKKECPCHYCEKRHVEHGYNCHSDCPEHKEWHDEREAKRELMIKKRSEEAMITDTRIRSMDRITGEKRKHGYWKG